MKRIISGIVIGVVLALVLYPLAKDEYTRWYKGVWIAGATADYDAWKKTVIDEAQGRPVLFRELPDGRVRWYVMPVDVKHVKDIAPIVNPDWLSGATVAFKPLMAPDVASITIKRARVVE